MAEHSVFLAECLCGQPIVSEQRTLTCQVCHRQIVLEWRYEPHAVIEDPRSTTSQQHCTPISEQPISTPI